MSGILLNYHKIPVIAILVIPVYWAEYYKNFQCCPEWRDLHYPPFPPIISPSMLKLTGQQTNWNANRGSCCPVGSLKTATQSNRNMSEIAQKKRQRSAWRKISLYYWLQVASIDQSNFLTRCSCRDLRQNCANSDAKNGCVIIKRGGKAQKQPFTLAMAVEAILCDKRKFCKVKTQTLETRGGRLFILKRKQFNRLKCCQIYRYWT